MTSKNQLPSNKYVTEERFYEFWLDVTRNILIGIEKICKKIDSSNLQKK